MTPINARREELERSRALMNRDIHYLLDKEENRIAALRAQVSALGPSATLERGYSIVQPSVKVAIE